MKPLITIVGVLGKQGCSAARTLLQSGRYRVRGSRQINPDSLSWEQFLRTNGWKGQKAGVFTSWNTPALSISVPVLSPNFFYTAYLFFSVKIDPCKLKITNGLLVVWFFTQFLSGSWCLFFIKWKLADMNVTNLLLSRWWGLCSNKCTIDKETTIYSKIRLR